jgi:hypothetical protein
MKLLKSAGLVLSLAVAATAFLAVGSAAAEATKFCKANEAKCSAANTLGGSFTGLAASFTEKPSEASMTMPPFPTVTCKLSKFNGQGFTSSGGPLIGKIGYWYNTECSSTTGTGCTMGTVVESPATLPAEVVNTVAGNGTIKVSSPVLGVECAGFKCTFSKPVMEFALTGGAHAKITANTTVSKTSGTCPITATFKANYEIWEPSSLFVTH